MDPVLEDEAAIPPSEMTLRVSDAEVGLTHYLRVDGVERAVSVRAYLQPGGVAVNLIVPEAIAHRIGHTLTTIFHPPTILGGWPAPAVWAEPPAD